MPTTREPFTGRDRSHLLQPSTLTAEQKIAAAKELSQLFSSTLAEVPPPEPKVSEPREPFTAPKDFCNAHNKIIDQLLLDPGVTTTRLSSVTGYSRSWLRRVMNSDAFQAKLAERQKAIIDPLIYSQIKDRLAGIASAAIERLEEEFDKPGVKADFALETLATVSKALGMGAQKTPVVQQTSFVVQMPTQIPSESDWAAAHAPNFGAMQAVEMVEPLQEQGIETAADAFALGFGATTATTATEKGSTE